jgi:hypothetical protein
MLPATMRRLRDSLKCAQHADGNVWDDAPLPNLTSGVMWTATGCSARPYSRSPVGPRAHADARLLAQKRDGKLRQPRLSVRGVP